MNVDLSNPLQKTWKYNAAKNRYEAYSEIGALSYPTGESLNVTEYFQMLSKDKQGDYFRQKTQSNAYALGGVKETNNIAIQFNDVTRKEEVWRVIITKIVENANNVDDKRLSSTVRSAIRQGLRPLPRAGS